MKPGSRAEFNFEQDLPDLVMGQAEREPETSGLDDVAAVLWVPDPEQRHGWREVYVRRTVQRRRRAMGFRR